MMDPVTIKILVAIISLGGTTFAVLVREGLLFPRKTLEVKVINNKTNQPIEGAIVQVAKNSKQTNSNGIVKFEKLRKGKKTYVVGHKEYKTMRGTLHIRGNDNFQSVALDVSDKVIRSNTQVTFEEPLDESAQFTPVSLIGSAKQMPPDKHYWIVVKPHQANGWWPQDEEIKIKPNNRWSGVANLGGSPGEKFDIHFMMATPSAHRAFQNYLAECAKTGDYYAAPKPSGVHSLSYITLIKK